jgi:hypothetical protein
MATFTYRLRSTEAGFLAKCWEMKIAAEGRTTGEAIESPRKAIADRFAEPNAMAPPSKPEATEISLAEAPPHPPPDPQGPGEAMGRASTILRAALWASQFWHREDARTPPAG